MRLVKIGTVTKVANEAATIHNYQVNHGMVDYIFVVSSASTIATQDKVTANVRNSSQDYICNKMDIEAFRCMADIENGVTDAKFAPIHVGRINTKETAIELEFEFKAQSADRTIMVYAFHNDNDEAECIMKYEQTSDMDRTVQDALKILVYGASGLTSFANKQLVEIYGDNENYSLDTYTAVKMTNAFGAKDNTQSNIAVVYESEDSIPDDIAYKIETVGSPVVTSVIIVREKRNSKKVSKSVIERNMRLYNKVAKFERKNPELARAYRRSSKIPASADIKQIINKANIK